MKKSAVILSLVLLVTVIINFAGCDSTKRSQYNIEITFDEQEKRVDGKMKVTYVNNTENMLDVVKFNVFFNAFREDAKMFPVKKSDMYKLYKNGFTYGESGIISVTNGKNALNYQLGGTDMTLLTVNLSKPLYPDEKAVICIEYSFKLCKAGLRTGYTDNVVNLGNFYPTLCVYDNGFIECPYYSFGDPFYSDTCDYIVKISLPNNYLVASSGIIKKSENKGNVTQKTYKLDNARDFAFVLSDRFKYLSAKAGDVTIDYYYINDNQPENSLKVAADAVNTFNRLFGNYAYKNYTVAETDFTQGGMEYPALSFISSDLEKQAYNEVIVHETAHQWWYGGVGNDQIAYGFLDEGLTEYTTVMFFDENKDYGLSKRYLMDNCENSYRSFCSIYNSFYKNVDTSMQKSLDKFNSEYEYVSIAYLKGCMFFNSLESAVGKESFLLALKEYYKTYCYKVATPYDLASVFTKIAGVPEKYFTSWYDGTAII